MEYNSGVFACPKCPQKRMYIYTNWQNRIIHINNSTEKQWIFFKKEIKKKRKCNTFFTFSCFAKPIMSLESCDINNKCCIYFIICPLIIIYMIGYLVLGLLIFVWIDLFSYLCCRKDLCEYTCLCIIGKILLTSKNFDDYEDKNIWNNCEGVLEHIILENGKELFICNECKWNPNTFLDFIPEYNDKPKVPIKDAKDAIDNNDNNTETDLNTNHGLNLNTDISIIFKSSENARYAMICKLNDTFEFVENKFYQKFPNLKNKNLDFVYHGQILTEKKKTLYELNIKDSDTVVFYEKIPNNYIDD